MMPNIWLQGSSPSLQGSQPRLQGSSPSLQGSSPSLQVTANPFGGGRLTQPSGSGYVAGASTGTSSGGGGGGAPSAGDVASQQQAQQIASLKEEIIARRQRANSIFSALTGAVQALAKSKRGELEEGYVKETEGAEEDFTRQSQLIAGRYRGRGLGDSSYKSYALEDAGEDYEGTLEDLGQARQSGLAQVGSDTDTLLAQLSADKASVNYDKLNEVGKRDDGTYDPQKLIELRSKIDERIRELGVQQSQLKTSKGFRGSLDKIAPYGGITDSLRNSLTALANSAAPKIVKDRLANTIISNYAPTDAQTWTNFYEEQTKKETVA